MTIVLIQSKPDRLYKILWLTSVLVVFFIVSVIFAASAFNCGGTSTCRGGSDPSVRYVKNTISSFRAQAALYYDEHNKSYEGLCTDKMTLQMFQQSEHYVQHPPVCNDSNIAYATGMLSYGSEEKGTWPFTKRITAPFFCADSTGFYGETMSELKEGELVCPAPLQWK